MSTSEPTPPAEPARNPPASPPPAEPPDWARELQRTIVELPGKLKAIVTDDDKDGIAERVHGLFERSGAFEAAPASDADKDVKQDETEAEHTGDTAEVKPEKQGKMSKFASWFEGS